MPLVSFIAIGFNLTEEICPPSPISSVHLTVISKESQQAWSVPHICQFWYTTALYRLKKYTKKCVDLHQNNQNLPKYCVPYALKYTGLKKYTTTAVLTNISYGLTMSQRRRIRNRAVFRSIPFLCKEHSAKKQTRQNSQGRVLWKIWTWT